MVERFEKREADYLYWVHIHPKGYVVNLDARFARAEYPMVHLASHKLVSSPLRSNYTTGDYVKVCSTELSELEQWSRRTFGRELIRCRVCM